MKQFSHYASMRLIAIFVLTCILVLSTLVTSVTYTVRAAMPVAKHCVIVLEKLHPGESVSRVQSKQCTTGDQPLVVPAARVQLMTMHEDIRYGGASNKIYGSDGPCDADGYGVGDFKDWFPPPLDGFWNNRISSFELWSNCNATSAFDGTRYTGTCQNYSGYQIDWVGSKMNDKISSLWIANGRYHRC